jgi:hypothetical protein
LSAVILKYAKEAEDMTDALRKLALPSVRWGHKDQFDFFSGVTVTNIPPGEGLGIPKRAGRGTVR